MKVAIIGYGFVGQAYHLVFPDAVIYDEPKDLLIRGTIFEIGDHAEGISCTLKYARDSVNECDIAIICVPTQLSEGTELDMSIVEDVVGWIETPLILIKSALMPGTVDRLVEKTGKKIAVSVEMVGEGNYFTPSHKYPDPLNPVMHDFLIVGGEEDTARRCADVLWAKMSPDINIHLVSAMEAEIVKLMENGWGGLKVSYANVIYDICEAHGANYTKVLQAWGADGRVEKMHMRVVPGKRGWGGKCYTKDIPALAELDSSGMMKAVVKANEKHVQADS